MKPMDLDAYHRIRSGESGYIEMPRGLIAVWGREAAQFLDGMITNDMKTLGDGEQMLAAFPNAQGRLLAVVRVLKQGERFLIETEEAMREKVFNNLFRFTFAGDFFVEDLSDQYRYFELFPGTQAPSPALAQGDEDDSAIGPFRFASARLGSVTVAISSENAERFLDGLSNAVIINDELYETLRIESGIPLYGVDMDENTIVPELGLDGLISYTKGCYIGQEIIARIHFRGHVAKQLTGLLSVPPAIAGGFSPGDELVSPDSKNAGRVTSVTYSPKLDKTIALAYVRYDHLAEGTELRSGNVEAAVTSLPFID